MNSRRTVRFVLACATLAVAVSASAQTTLRLAEPLEARPGQASTPSPEAKGQPMPQGFSVVLVLGEGQGTTVADNVPAAARKALADMKDFLPYRGYRLLDAAWILGSQRSTSRLRGPDDQEYQLTVQTTQVAGGKIQVRYLMQESTPVAVFTSREPDEVAARRAAEAESLRAQVAASDAGDMRSPRALVSGRNVIDTTFTMDVGETVVVGTSRVRGGDKALIALLTAVPRGGAAAKKE